MSSTVFLLGAGFSVDAAEEAGNPLGVNQQARYPLVPELANLCFGPDALSSGGSIEALFDDAIKARNPDPIKKLCECVMEADYYITEQLVYNRRHETNVYSRFLEDFPTSPLLTFNYDSLPELLLLVKGLWRPDDGYGVPVKTELAFSAEPPDLPETSTRPVLHLHGSLCVYPVDVAIRRRPGDASANLYIKDVPDFIFSPGRIGRCFCAFEGVPAGLGFRYEWERVIAPIPDKAEGLKGKFVRAVYEKARALMARASRIAVIGYSFSPHDRASYHPLLEAASGHRVLVVAPDAESSIGRLRGEYPEIRWVGESLKFKTWVSRRYPGLKC